MRRPRVILLGLLLVAVGALGALSARLYAEALNATTAAARWQEEARGWQSLAQRTALHDAVATRTNRQLVRRYNRLAASAATRQQELLAAVQTAQQATTAREAAAAAAAAQSAATQPAAAIQNAPAAQPAPAAPPASAAS